MDVSLSVGSEDGDMPWSDTHSMDSDDGSVFKHSPHWGPLTASAISNLHTGQLSPISTGMDVAGLDTTSSISSTTDAAALGTSASSHTTWGSGFPDQDTDKDVDHDMNWGEPMDETMAMPKIEPMDDDGFHMEDVNPAPQEAIGDPAKSDGAAAPKVKRPRGRPRKHPHPPVVSTNKVTKGRSKTGCITCRKRKKKCDEAKPRCMNCEKNAVVCEGYHEKQLWKSGKEKAEEERLRRESLPQITMPSLFHGVETPEDRIFWKHYCDHLSTVLTVEGEARNAFKDIMVPLATKHRGLMHSILALAGKHIDYSTPYGAKILKDNANSTSLEALHTRAAYHHSAAVGALLSDQGTSPSSPSSPEIEEDDKVALSGRFGQMLCLLLQNLVDGDDPLLHLKGYQNLIATSQPADPAFTAFITEFFQYHVYMDELLRPLNRPSLLTSDSFEPPVPIHPPRLLGVADGLFCHLAGISRIRATIRKNVKARVDPIVDYTCLYRAAEIDDAIREWSPCWPPGDGRDRVALLYKQMLWVHLFRSIYPPKGSVMRTPPSRPSFSRFPLHSPMIPLSGHSSAHSSPTLAAGADAIMSNIAVLPPPMTPVDSTQHSPQMRPLSSSSSASTAATPSSLPSSTTTASTTPLMHPTVHTGILTPCLSFSGISPSTAPQRSCSNSPPPLRTPTNDPRITATVDSALSLLDSFKPSDPCQTLLLIPCLLVGTACFLPEQRERIRIAIKAVRGYTGLGYCDRVEERLEKCWTAMDQGRWGDAWGWEAL